MRSIRPFCETLCLVTMAALMCPAHTSKLMAQEDKDRVQFDFSGTPWRSVVQWLADSAGLALHVNDLPLGSFTYSDDRDYTCDEAINRINMFLIPKRYSLVRSERLLSVISLDDEASIRQLDAMARVVTPNELPRLGSQDFVKCFFPLREISPDHALEELNGLMLTQEPQVLRNSNQLMVMDTAAKLRTVAQVLKALEEPAPSTGPVKVFPLGDLDPEQVLIQVRPHVGLDPLAMIGADIRLSIDKQRRQLLASGSTDKLQAIHSVMTLLHEVDVSATQEDFVFRPHDLAGADLQTVVNVLHTLLADEDVRLAADAKSQQLAILAREHVHELVDDTIRELSGVVDPLEFRVIEVFSVDARYAAAVLKEMFAVQGMPPEDGATMSESPRIEADGRTGRLFVRARRSQFAEIEQALLQFDPVTNTGSPKLRLLPYYGEQAKGLLEAAQKFWPYEDRIEVVSPPTDADASAPLEREIESRPPPRKEPIGKADSRQESNLADWKQGPDSECCSALPERRMADVKATSPATLVAAGRTQPQTSAVHSLSPEPERARIRVQWTPHGLLAHSDEVAALRRFERHLELITGARSTEERRLAVFYLKHASVSDVNSLLRQLLNEEVLVGGQAVVTRYKDPLDVRTASEAFPDPWSDETATIIPDRRLNRLFVYGNHLDLKRVEEHLQVIDRENSIAHLKTRGTPRMIPLVHTQAADMAAVIRDVYAGRIASTAAERKAVAAASRQDRSRRDSEKPEPSVPAPTMDGTAEHMAEGSESKMTLAVDRQSNALVVTAPSQLSDEVETLVLALDQEGKQTVQVTAVTGVNPIYIRESLRSMLGASLGAEASESAAADRQ